MGHFFSSMEDILIQAAIGLIAGFVGGLLGVGGSIIIIPCLITYMSHKAGGYSGSQQHLVQAAAMICNVFIALPAVWGHYRARAIINDVVRQLIPTALLGVALGVALSNSPLFAQDKGRHLLTGFTIFLLYVAGYNLKRLFSTRRLSDTFDPARKIPSWKVAAVGLPMGITAGLLGIGGGALCVPAQQLILRIPLRYAIANSAATIVCSAILGALYKNITLAQHAMSIHESLRMAAMIIPSAIVGSLIGSRLTHLLPRHLLRIAFIIFVLAVAWLTFSKARKTADITSDDKIQSTVTVHRNCS